MFTFNTIKGYVVKISQGLHINRLVVLALHDDTMTPMIHRLGSFLLVTLYIEVIIII